MILTDTDVSEAEVMKGGDQRISLLITKIEDIVVLKTGQLEDQQGAEIILTMMDCSWNTVQCLLLHFKKDL